MESRNHFTEQKIRELCQAKKTATTSGNGIFNVGSPHIHQLTLLANDVKFHNLSYDALNAALAGIVNSSLHPNQILITCEDMYFAWSWCAQLFLNSNTDYLTFEDYDLKELLKNAVISAHTRGIASDTAGLGHYERLLVSRSTHIFPYLTFPLLEAILRKSNQQYINRDGSIIKYFDVPDKNGGIIKYGKGKGEKKRCSSVRDLLHLYYKNTIPSTRKFMDEALQCVGSQSTKHPFDQIYDWRNGLMHGNDSLNLAGCAILTLCFVILLSETFDDYESMRERAIEFIDIYRHRPGRADWIYYPPY